MLAQKILNDGFSQGSFWALFKGKLMVLNILKCTYDFPKTFFSSQTETVGQKNGAKGLALRLLEFV